MSEHESSSILTSEISNRNYLKIEEILKDNIPNFKLSLALQQACEISEPLIVKAILNAGANPNRLVNGRSILYYLFNNSDPVENDLHPVFEDKTNRDINRLTILNFLLENGLVIDSKDLFCCNPLDYCWEYGFGDKLNLCLEKLGKETYSPSLKVQLITACKKKMFSRVNSLLSKEIPPNSRSLTEDQNKTALMYSCLAGDIDTVSLLLARGATVWLRTRQRFTTSRAENFKGQDISISENYNKSELNNFRVIPAVKEKSSIWYAVKGGKIEIVKLLLRELPPEIDVRTEKSPLDLAFKLGRSDMIDLLMSSVYGDFNSYSDSSLSFNTSFDTNKYRKDNVVVQFSRKNTYRSWKK